MLSDWPHQTYGVSEVRRLMDAGVSRICLTSPTGGGKSRMVHRMIEWGLPTVVYANRIALIEQLARGMNEQGIPFGMAANGYAPSHFDNVTIASIPTVASRLKRNREYPPHGELIIVDELHNEKATRMQELQKWHLDRGATFVGMTATPVGVGHLADELVVAGVTSELRKCGALLRANIFAPIEPSSKAFKRQVKGVLQFDDSVKEVMLPIIFGSVIKHYRELNPNQRPAILFAPGVEESVWFTEQMMEAGIPWSHIDGDRIILNGEPMAASRDNRKALFEASRTGRTKGISNRFVLREGIDLPWLYNCIFACTFGSITSFLQAGGRILRNHKDLEDVLVVDHGGNWWRHDSLNMDRTWSLDDTDESIREAKETAYRNKEEAEPISCPKCGFVRRKGISCPSCGFTYSGKRRTVIQTDGTLVQVDGDIYKPKRVNNMPDAEKRWVQTYWRMRRAGGTFTQAIGLYQRENKGMLPDPTFAFMPQDAADKRQKIDKVPYNRLTSNKCQVADMATTAREVILPQKSLFD